jgi:hypothetical protein
MMTRQVALVLVTLLLTGCLEPPVTESVEVRVLPHGSSIVSIGVTLRDPADYDKAPRVKQRLESEGRALLDGTDAWSDRLRRVDAERQRDTIDREHGGLRGVTRQALLQKPEDLRQLFRDTGVDVAYAEGKGWAELRLTPGRPSRATTAQRQRVAGELDFFCGNLANYAGAVKSLYDYLDANPSRARACFADIFDVKNGDDDSLTDQESELVSQVNDAIGMLVPVLSAESGEPYTIDELSRLVFDPFPASMSIVVSGPVIEREGFPGDLKAPLAIPAFSIWSAFQRLEGRWLSPDPALALWRHDAVDSGDPFDLEGFLAQRRRAGAVPSAGEVRRAVERELKPAEAYRVKWSPSGD